MCFLLTIPIFIGYYALFVLVCHGIKTGLYAYFKSHRKEWNSIADREEMEEHIAQNLGQIQKKAQEKTATITNTKNAVPIADDTPKRESNVESHSPKEVSVTHEALATLQLLKTHDIPVLGGWISSILSISMRSAIIPALSFIRLTSSHDRHGKSSAGSFLHRCICSRQ